jgi:hypothetical protein
LRNTSRRNQCTGTCLEYGPARHCSFCHDSFPLISRPSHGPYRPDGMQSRPPDRRRSAARPALMLCERGRSVCLPSTFGTLMMRNFAYPTAVSRVNSAWRRVC